MFEVISASGCLKTGQVPSKAGRFVLLVALALPVAGLLTDGCGTTTARAQNYSNARKAVARKKAARVKRSKKLRKSKASEKRRGSTKREARKAVRSPANRPSQTAYKKKLNQNTVTLMSGCCTNGAYTAFGADIKDMIALADDKNGLRVLPVLGGGAGTNVRDLLYLRGVDMAIVNTDVIDFFKGRPLYEKLGERIHYITRLFNEEVHVFVGADITSLEDLQGARIGFNNSNAEVTGTILFKKLGIKPGRTMRISEGDGALAMREGRLDAMIRVTGKPIRNTTRLKSIFPQIKLLPVAFDPVFIGSHLPTRLTHEDYPGLIKKGESVPTIATRTILAVFNWKPGSDRYRRLAKFTRTFFDHFDHLRQSQNLHPKWAEVNLMASVPGLKRFAPAQKWIDQKTGADRKPSVVSGHSGAPAAREKLMKDFKMFLASRGRTKTGSEGADNSEKLISDFLRWQAKQNGTAR